MALDSTPPEALAEMDVEVRRGRGPEQSGCGGHSSTSLDDLGWVLLTFAAPGDDRTPAEKMGYMVALTAGEPPEGMHFPSEPWRAFSHEEGAALQLSWVDGASDDQESVDFTVTVTPMDLAGNQGPAFEVRIREGGSGEFAGCTAASPSRPCGLVVQLVVLVGLLLLARRTGAARR